MTIKDGGVVTAELADDAVTAAKIADDAVGLAAMASGTDGNLITYDASGNPAHVATGSAGEVLTSAGAGAAPTFVVVGTNGITLGAELAGADNTVSRVNLKDYGEITQALGSSGGSRTIDISAGNSVSATVSSSTVTWTFSNPTASDELCGFTLVLTNGGSQTVNWPASVDWAGGTAPTLTASGVDILVFITQDGGTNFHGFAASLDSKTPS